MTDTPEVVSLRLTAANQRNALEHIRVAAALHYMGQAFDPEHMRGIANLATSALNGDPIPAMPDPEDIRKEAAIWESLFGDDEDVVPVDPPTRGGHGGTPAGSESVNVARIDTAPSLTRTGLLLTDPGQPVDGPPLTDLGKTDSGLAASSPPKTEAVSSEYAPLADPEGNPIYLSEQERMLDEVTRTGKTSTTHGEVTAEIDWTQQEAPIRVPAPAQFRVPGCQCTWIVWPGPTHPQPQRQLALNCAVHVPRKNFSEFSEPGKDQSL